MYQLKAGARLKAKVDPNIIGMEIDRLCREHGGKVGAADVVRAARTKTSPLHPLFDWNDTEAARSWRIHQARMLLCYVVRVETNPSSGKEIKIRQYVVTKRESDGRSYEPIISVMSDADRREMFLGQALAELEDWQERYDGFVEFSEIYDSIQLTKRKVTVKKKSKHGRNSARVAAVA